MRVVLRFLVVVMLLTVLSPKFGWESVSAAETHVHAVEAMAHAGHELAADCPSHALGHEGMSDAGDHHCCPGHVLGHLLGGVGDGFSLPAMATSSALLPGGEDRFSSRTPEGLERPPRSAA